VRVNRVRVFIDYWNFQLAWNRTIGKGCDWRELPRALVRHTGELFETVGADANLTLERTTLYASVDPDADANLRRWLTATISRFPSYTVRVYDRRARRDSIHCRLCKVATGACPNCGEPYVRRPEKGVDSAIVTDLLSLAWEDAYDVAILVTSDADFVPAVERVQERGVKVVNAAWRHRGHELQRTCWASFAIDEIEEELCR
jgi:uncharacterized LabA/DUF88 family protein